MQNQKFKGKGKQFILALAAILLVMGVVCGVVLNSNKMHVSKETPIKVKVLGITENVTSGSTAKSHEDGEKIEEREDKLGTDGKNTEAGEQVESTEVSQIAGKKPENAVITIGDVNYASRNHTIKLELDGTDNEKVANSTLTINDIVVLVNETPVSATKSFEIENEDLNDGKNGRKYVLVLTNVPGDGRLSVTIPANTLVDEAGNQNDEINSTFDEEIIIDNTAPTKPTYAATYADNSAYTSGTWTNKDVYTTISTEEASSGVEEIQYSLDQSTWTKLNFTSGSLTQSGTTWSGKEPWSKTNGKNDTIYFRAIDNVGNVSEISDLFNIRYDTSAPTLSLTKETYQEGFDGWELPEGASIDNDGVLTMTQAGTVGNKYYRTGNEKWYITFDGYTETASNEHPGWAGSAGPGDGGIHFGALYFDSNYNSTNAQNNNSTNGFAPSLPLNTWSNNFSFNGYNGYGNSIEYVRVRNTVGDQYSQPPVKIRNFKMHGQLFEKFYNISVTSNGTNSNIVKTKWLAGEKTVADFASAGEKVTNRKFEVTENGIYTVYVEDEAGNGAVSTIEVTKIDKTAPIIEANAKFNGASISFTAKDIAPNEKEAPSGVVGYQITDSNTEPTSGWTNVVVPEVTTVDGKKQTSQTINITNSGLTAGTHYIWVIDAVGHKTSKEINVYYTIAFNAGEGITTQGTETKEVNSATLPDIEIPTKTGYDFKGYFTEINGGGTQYYGPDGKAVKENDFTRDRILYAKWEGAKYTVTANANGGTILATSGWTGTGETVTKQVTYDSSYGALPTARNVSRAGYTFKGWKINGEGDFITNETIVTTTSDHTLKAIWEGNPYTVHFDKNDSQEKPAVGEMADQEFVYEQAQNLTANEFVRIGYIFKGWNTKADGTGTNYTDKQSVSNLIATANGVVNLYAKWEEANATFVTGKNFNVIAKKLAGNLNATYTTQDFTITQIKYATIGSGDDKITLEKLKEIKANAVNSDATISKDTKYVKVSVDAQSNTPIYVWFENNKLYWFSEDDTPSMNEDASYMFGYMMGATGIPELNKMDTSNVTNMDSLFSYSSSLTSLDVSKFDTKKVTNMSEMFDWCFGLTSLNVSGFNTENVTDMGYMFEGCNGLTSLDVSRFNTENVNDMSYMFNQCKVLTSLDVSRFNTENVKNMSGMFQHCNNLTSLNLSGFNTENVKNMSGMFNGCNSLTSLDVSGFNTENVTDMRIMFKDCNSLTSLDLRNFNTSSVTNMDQMFDYCHKLKTIYATDLFVVNNGTTTTDMFRDCSVLEGGNSTKFSVAGVTGGTYAWIDGKNNKPGYFTNHYHIVFNKNSTQATGEMATQNIPFGKRVQLSTLGFNTTGGNFLGWSTTETGNVVFSATDYMEYDLAGIKAIAQDTADDKNITLTLYAQWGVNTYSIKFNANGGTGTMADLPMTYGTPANLTTNGFSKTGYSFVKWTTNADGTGEDYTNGEEVNNLTAENGVTVNLYAQWTAKKYTVTLNAGDGTINAGNDGWARAGDNKTATKDITYDSAYGTLPTASRTGYTFASWYTEATGGTKVTNTTKMQTASAVTLYPHWTANPYKIKFNANGGTGTMADLDMKYDTAKKLTSNEFTKTGYHFKEWTTNADGTGTKYTDGQSVNNLTTENGATVALYAQWEANQYTVSFDSNDGTPTPASKSVTYDSAYGTLPSAEDVSKTGYTFKGWKINGEGDFITNETIVTTASNHTLKAVWEAKKYTLTISADGGTIPATTGWNLINDGASANKEVTFDSAYGVIPKPSKPGCTFDGWYTGENGTGDKVTETTKYTTDGTTTLHAKWTANTYTIHFDANGGTGEMTDLPMTYGTPANLTANAFSRTGYKFVKWTTNADGTGNEYIDGQSVNNLTVINNATINLFAQWEERPFVVTFNPNGGIVTPGSKEITYNSTYGDLPSGDNIKRLGYTFAGWYKEPEFTNQVTAETTYDITDDSTLYAKWTPHTYTVTFDKNGGTGTMSDQSFTYGQEQNLRANTFTRTGYTFAGWARAENGTVEFTNGQSVSNLTPENSGTITLYAVWTDITMPSWRVILLNIINK